MFDFFKKMFCGCDGKQELATKLEDAHRQDREIRESLTENEIDKGLKDTMDASDPVAKY